MFIESVKITSFRNIFEADLSCLSNFNLFHGDNGSGKTSLLEALYCLTTARSFRTAQAQNMISHGQAHFQVVVTGKTSEGESHRIGFERSQHGQRICRLDGENCQRISTISSLIPIKLITANSHELLTSGPTIRRELLDWGLFHVKHLYHSAWSHYQRALKQRNAALKAGEPPVALKAWGAQLAEAGELIHELRLEYLSQLKPIVSSLLGDMLPEYLCHLTYHRGWPDDATLAEALDNALGRDQAAGFTTQGPHRADVCLETQEKPVADILSQGQLKQAAYAIHLAQGELMYQVKGQSPIFLIDDLPSELDSTHQHRVGQVLIKLHAQTFLTGIEAKPLQDSMGGHPHQMFHVKQGNIIVEESLCMS